jgi:uncharacterized protein (UPF0548 family)
MMSELTYPEVGATECGVLPSGYRHLRYRTKVGGPDAFAFAAEAILTWRLHRAAGVPMRVGAPRAAPGVRTTSVFGVAPLRVTVACQVVWAAREHTRAGFAYGTLAGHPVRGEEAFEVAVQDGAVWFGVTAFSRPAAWYTRAAGPVLPVLQGCYARHLGRVLRRLCADPPNW